MLLGLKKNWLLSFEGGGDFFSFFFVGLVRFVAIEIVIIIIMIMIIIIIKEDFQT